MRACSFVVWIAFVAALSLPVSSLADDPGAEDRPSLLDGNKPKQEMLTFEVLVLGADGEPVEAARVKPWAIRSSQGHGMWNVEGVGAEPIEVTTDEQGKATITYPKYSNVGELISATNISLSIDHIDHPFVSHEDVAVPTAGVHEAKLPKGSAIEVTLTQDGERQTSEQIHVMTNGGRAWYTSEGATITPNGDYRVPPIAEGTGQLLFVRIEDEVPTHFSPIVSFDIDAEKPIIRKEVELLPARKVRGKLSDNVPRPVKMGRVKVQTVSPGKSWDEISWFSWAEVNEDGTFEVQAWPADEPMQLIALCDGYMAKSGKKPSMVTPERGGGGYLRPQVFEEPSKSEIVVEMTPLVTCKIKCLNAFDKPLADVNVGGFPNVGWWNGGSQIYGFPLMRCADILLGAEYSREDGEGIFAQPFKGKSDENGELTLQMPEGRETLWAGNKKYLLPINAGRRYKYVDVVAGDPMEIELVMQPKGLDVLGDWEDLCGLVFG